MLKDRSQGGGGQVVEGEHETRLRFRLLGLRVHPRLVRSVPDGESCGSAQDEYTTDMDGSIYLRLVTSEKNKNMSHAVLVRLSPHHVYVCVLWWLHLDKQEGWWVVSTKC